MFIILHMQFISRTGPPEILRLFTHFREYLTIFVAPPAVDDLHSCYEILLYLPVRSVCIVQCHIQLERSTVFQRLEFIFIWYRLINLQLGICKKLLRLKSGD